MTAVNYALEPAGPPLYPRMHGGCFYCAETHDPDGYPVAPSACPVRFVLPRPGAAA